MLGWEQSQGAKEGARITGRYTEGREEVGPSTPLWTIGPWGSEMDGGSAGWPREAGTSLCHWLQAGTRQWGPEQHRKGAGIHLWCEAFPPAAVQKARDGIPLLTGRAWGSEAAPSQGAGQAARCLSGCSAAEPRGAEAELSAMIDGTVQRK